MIPNFPEFKKIELSDKDQVEQITGAFLPYSDFDFISMVSWDVSGEMGFSLLNGNLVVRFSDYISHKPYFGFIGKNMPNETVKELLTYSNSQNMEPILKFIPEEVAKEIDQSEFLVTEDRNGFDYIYSTEAHRSFSGGDFARKRNEVSSILKSHPAIKAVELDVYDSLVQERMVSLYKKWAENKLADIKDFEAREEAAFHRLIETAKKNIGHLKGIGVYHDNELLAFCIFEIANPEYAVGHTAKCDVTIKGTNAILMKTLADLLYNAGIKYFNYEQDLGLENLRISKERYRPSFFLKKYLVTEL